MQSVGRSESVSTARADALRTDSVEHSTHGDIWVSALKLWILLTNSQFTRKNKTPLLLPLHCHLLSLDGCMCVCGGGRACDPSLILALQCYVGPMAAAKATSDLQTKVLLVYPHEWRNQQLTPGLASTDKVPVHWLLMSHGARPGS